MASFRSIKRVAAFLTGVLAVSAHLHATGVPASFQGIGDLPGGSFLSHALAVSADGTTPVGFSSGAAVSQAVRWTSAAGLQSLGSLSGSVSNEALGISGDGSIIVGIDVDVNNHTKAFRWTAANGMTALGFLPGGIQNEARGISADGNIIVGDCLVQINRTTETHAVKWVGASVIDLGALSGHSYSSAAAASGDGSVIAGTSSNSPPALAVIWTAQGISSLGDFPGGPISSGSHAISQDGLAVVGHGNTGAGTMGFRWTASTGLVALGGLPFSDGSSFQGGGTISGAFAVSADGSVVAGEANSSSGIQAFVWDQTHGMRSVKDLLTSSGINMSGWKLEQADGISADGLTLVGVGTNPAGQQEGWIARLEEPDADGDGLPDSWETVGIPYISSTGQLQHYPLDVDLDGTPDCNPNHKDLLVEVDAMSGLAPSIGDLQRVINAFAVAPVSNPDSLPGIALHVLIDDTTIPPAAWTLDDTNGNGTPDWPTEFDALKLTAVSGTALPGYFGPAAERNHPDAAALRSMRKKAWRYCIFGKQLNPGDSTSGLAEVPGNDFIISLGLWDNGSGTGAGGGTPTDRAGTFMHELGHTLGLHHGGDDDINFKPNYYSVMSYSWQTPKPWNAPGSWPLDSNRPGYSTFAIPSLDESALIDCQSMVVPGSLLAGVKFPYNTLNDPANPPAVVNGRFDALIDWDGQALCSSSPIAADVNRVRDNLIGSPGQTLVGHDDWPALVYDFRGAFGFADGAHNAATAEGAVLDLTEVENTALKNLFPLYCGADINDDRTVNVDDLLAVINGWGPCGPLSNCVADIAPNNPDGTVNVDDLLAIINAWGPCPN